MIKIEPTSEHPVPYSTEPERPKTFEDELAVATNTVDVLQELGASINIETEDIDKTVALIKSRKNVSKELSQPQTAFAASLFLKSYANRVAINQNEVRSAITAKLLEIANCGDPRFELKALELLGKQSDIGLFTERSEITVHHTTSAGLETAIKDRIKRLLNTDVIDITPLSQSLDEELGVFTDEDEVKEDNKDDEGDDEQLA
jgi:hypothetical protein